MYQILLALAMLIIGAGLYFSERALNDKKLQLKSKEFSWRNIFEKIVSILFFALYMPHLFSLEVISVQEGLAASYFSTAGTILIVLLKWFTFLAVAVTILLPVYDKREANYFTTFITPIVAILNLIFLDDISVSIIGRPMDWSNWRMIVYCTIIVLMGGISLSKLADFIVDKKFDNFGKSFGKMWLYTLFYMPAFLPAYTLQLFFGVKGQECADFTLTHRLLLYAAVFMAAFIAIIFMKRSYEERRYVLLMLALSGFMQYFYLQPQRGGITDITVLPMHLCNTAIVLMFFAYLFKLKGVFYFTYFINIMGALMAMLLPNTHGSILDISNVMFYYNHTYALILPLLGVSIKVFPRPNFKMILKAIAAFSCYVLIAAVLDAWFNNSPTLNPMHHEIDYFFLYGDFFVDKFAWAYPIKMNYILTIQVGNTKLVFYYLYILTVWAISIGLTFAMWGFYGLLYRTGDAHRELARRKKMVKIDELDLLKEMKGRSVKEPLHPEGANMIKIINFGKTYAGSTKEAVHDVNLEIHEGEVFGFIGHNGAGKSTTIKSMVGIQTISQGRIEIQGYDIARQPLEAKLNIGYVSDNHAVYEKLTGREYVSYVADLYMVNEKDKQERLDKYVKMFKLEEAIDREIKSYSHGMKQKIMVISALIHNPKVWVLDEPLTGLDPTSSWQIKECMREHANAGNIVFFSSHVIEVVEKICDRVAIISGGRLRRVCTPEELKSEGLSLEQIYLKYAVEGAKGEEVKEITDQIAQDKIEDTANEENALGEAAVTSVSEKTEEQKA